MNRYRAEIVKALPNSLTLFRILLAILLNVCISKRFGILLIPVILFLLIYLSDFLDGKVARHYGNTSKFGAVFDIVADLFYVVATYATLCAFGVIPLWFFILVILKFAEFASTSFILRQNNVENPIFVFDFIGRCVAVLFLFVPLSAYVSFMLFQTEYFSINLILIYCVSFMAVVSSSYRIWCCYASAKATYQRKRHEPLSGNSLTKSEILGGYYE